MRDTDLAKWCKAHRLSTYGEVSEALGVSHQRVFMWSCIRGFDGYPKYLPLAINGYNHMKGYSPHFKGIGKPSLKERGLPSLLSQMWENVPSNVIYLFEKDKPAPKKAKPSRKRRKPIYKEVPREKIDVITSAWFDLWRRRNNMRTYKEIADLWGVSKQAVHQWYTRDKFPKWVLKACLGYECTLENEAMQGIISYNNEAM